MKIVHHNIPFFHISLIDIFSTEELKIIFKEIHQLKKYFKDPNFTGSASNKNEILKKNTGMFLSSAETKIYENLKIIKFIDKYLKKISEDNNWKNIAFKRLFNSLMWGSEIVNCYGENDYYKPHIDYGIFTVVIFLWEDNSNFDGGDLYFPDHDYLHKCYNNNGILFFSKELHEVTPLIISQKMSFRYSIATFSTQRESDGISIKRNPNNFTTISYQ